MRSVDQFYRGRNVRAFRINRERVLCSLRDRALLLRRERPDVLDVRLFGSLARDQATPGSDADVFVLLDDGAPPMLDRLPPLARYFAGCGIGCDVVAYTRSELERLRAEASRFVRELDAAISLIE